MSIDDVKTHARQALTRSAAPGAPTATPALPDFSHWGPVEREPMTRVRRAVARRMSLAWQTVAHVTQHDRTDVSEFEAVRKTVKKTSPDLPLTVTALAVAVVAAALKAFPKFNASLDTERSEIIYKGYINIRVAVNSERGLVVPVIREADQKSLGALSTEIAILADKVRTRKATPQDLEGGTFTITNLGGLGGTSFTPIVNYPEVAILGLSRAAAHSAALPVVRPLSDRRGERRAISAVDCHPARAPTAAGVVGTRPDAVRLPPGVAELAHRGNRLTY